MRTSRMLVFVASLAAVVATALSTAPLASAVTALDVTGSLSPNPVTFPALNLGATSAPQDVTLTNQGTDPLVVSGDATINGTDPDSFQITNDACSGVTLATGQTCKVTVITHPFDRGDISALLDIPDSSTAGVEEATLETTSNDVTHGLYYPVTSARILDTRNGIGATKRAVTSGQTVQLQVFGKGHVPNGGASAVVLNVTVTRAASSGHVTAYPGGTSLPTASSINFAKGWTGANLVTVPIGSNGKVNLYSSASSVDLIADVQGWYASSDTVTPAYGVGGAYGPQDSPVRLIDTRVDGGHNPLPAGYSEEVAAYYDSSIPVDDIHALAITLTATGVHGSGYMTATDVNSDPTTTSTLNLQSGVTTPNMAVVAVHPCTESWCDDPTSSPVVFQVFNGSSHPVDFLADVSGAFYSDTVSALRYRNLAPTRIVDTRVSKGTTKLGAASTHSIVVPASVNGYDTFAVSSNITAVTPTAKTYLEVWPNKTGGTKPAASNLNPQAGQTVATGALIGIGDNQEFNVYNASGTTNLLVDVSGSFDYFPSLLTLPQAAAAQPGLARSQLAMARQAAEKRQADLGAVKGAAAPARPLSAG